MAGEGVGVGGILKGVQKGWGWGEMQNMYKCGEKREEEDRKKNYKPGWE